jgi:hypothetical protein
MNIENISYENRWVVFKIGGGAPTVCHKTKESAIEEATRLSTLYLNSKFVVSEATNVIGTILWLDNKSLDR